jgi:U11/U12 small nuclear ribonucleoprotein SNRNP65
MYVYLLGTLYQHTNEETEEEDESELESDTEDNTILPEIIPTKRKRLQTTKRMKIPKFVKPIKNITSAVSTQKIKPEDIFESIQRGETKNLKIELKTLDKPLDVTIANQDNDVMLDSGFGLIYPTNKNSEDKKNNEENVETPKNKFITSEELATNRISANDQRVLPVFKNYHPGKPSNRLYIKNLTKQVEMKDLDYIYQRFVITGLKDVESE